MITRNSTLIITGASTGIGKALSVGLAKLGVNLVLNARGREPLEEAVFECSNEGIKAVPVPGDISKSEIVTECLKKAEEIGALSGFIHVAGTLCPGPYIWELEEVKFNKIFDVHVKASYLLIRYVVPKLLSSGTGMAVFVGSGAADLTQPGIAAYCAAKAAQEHLARQLAAETGRVTCFVYRPGMVDTRMHEQAREAVGGAAKNLHDVFRPLKENNRLLTPEQSADALIRILQGDIRTRQGRIITAP